MLSPVFTSIALPATTSALVEWTLQARREMTKGKAQGCMPAHDAPPAIKAVFSADLAASLANRDVNASLTSQ